MEKDKVIKPIDTYQFKGAYCMFECTAQFKNGSSCNDCQLDNIMRLLEERGIAK